MKSRQSLNALNNRYVFAALFITCFSYKLALAAQPSIHKIIVLDPGHSINSPGTTSCSGVPEHVFNDELAKSISEYLRLHKIKVLLTRKPNEHLENRKRATKYDKADIYVALHHDSAQPRYLEPVEKGRGHCSHKFRGFSLFISGQNRQYSKSFEYARKLADSLLAKGYSPTLHHAEDIPGEHRELVDSARGIYRRDDLTVLKDNGVPAILLEAGVIIHPDDEALVATDKFRKNIASSFLEMLR